MAAGLALGLELPEAAARAQRYVAGAIRHAPGIGHGRGGGDPVAGFAIRYVGLPAPILCACYFAVLLYGGMFTSAIVRGCTRSSPTAMGVWAA